MNTRWLSICLNTLTKTGIICSMGSVNLLSLPSPPATCYTRSLAMSSSITHMSSCMAGRKIGSIHKLDWTWSYLIQFVTLNADDQNVMPFLMVCLFLFYCFSSEFHYIQWPSLFIAGILLSVVRLFSAIITMCNFLA